MVSEGEQAAAEELARELREELEHHHTEEAQAAQRERV